MTDRKGQKQKSLPPIFRPAKAEELPMEQWRVVMLAEFQYLCTRMEHWRHCRLPRCRRSRRCTGSNDLNTRDRRFPPCMRDDADHAALLRELRVYEAELQAAYHCFAD